MAHGRMQVKRAVRLMTVQEDRNGHDGDVSEGQGDHDQAPPWQVKYA